MDDQALVEGSVVFKDEDDPATKTRVRQSTACHKCRRVNRLGSCSSLNTPAHSGRDMQPLVPILSPGHMEAAGAPREHRPCIPARLPRFC